MSLLTLFFCYATILMLLSYFENSLVYPGSKYPHGDWEPADFNFEEVEFAASDGMPLVGWYLPQSNARETILLAHGNAENAAQASAYMGDLLRVHLNANVFVFDYRGYGKSGGSPDEPGVLLDSEAALAWLCERESKAPGEIILCGHSLGGGPAVHLAAKSGAKALIVQQSFCSITAAAGYHYPWIPVSWIMRNRFPSDEKIKNYTGPYFQSHGTADRVVAFAVGEKLFDAAVSPNKQFFKRQGEGHYDHRSDEYWNQLRTFLADVKNENTATRLIQSQPGSEPTGAKAGNKTDNENLPDEFIAVTAERGSRCSVNMNNSSANLEINPASGIDTVSLRCLDTDWPENIVVRLHTAGLESLAIESGNTGVSGGVSSTGDHVVFFSVATASEYAEPNGGESASEEPIDDSHPLWPEMSIRSANKKIPVVDGCFEFTIARELLADPEQPLTISWVDFFR